MKETAALDGMDDGCGFDVAYGVEGAESGRDVRGVAIDHLLGGATFTGGIRGSDGDSVMAKGSLSMHGPSSRALCWAPPCPVSAGSGHRGRRGRGGSRRGTGDYWEERRSGHPALTGGLHFTGPVLWDADRYSGPRRSSAGRGISPAAFQRQRELGLVPLSDSGYLAPRNLLGLRSILRGTARESHLAIAMQPIAARWFATASVCDALAQEITGVSLSPYARMPMSRRCPLCRPRTVSPRPPAAPGSGRR